MPGKLPYTQFPEPSIDFHFSLAERRRGMRPLIIAHRGGAALAPENTIEGYRYVKSHWAPDVYELDVRISADGHPVVIHDKRVDRTTNGIGKVSELPLSHMKILDAGYWFTNDGGFSYPWRSKGVRIPALTEVLDAFPHDHFNIEVKKSVPGIELQLACIVGERDLTEQVLVLSRDTDMLARLSHLDPRIQTASVFSEKTIIARVANPALSPIVRSLVRRGRRRGIQLEVWTVNDPSTMALLLESGVDGLVTDYPDVALEVFRKLGLRAPKPSRHGQKIPKPVEAYA